MVSKTTNRVNTSVSLTEYAVPEFRYSQLFLERGYKYNYKARWGTVKPSYEKLLKHHPTHDPIVVNQTGEGDEAVVYNFSGGMVLVDIEKKQVRVEIASLDNSETDAEIKKLKKIFKPVEETTDKVKIRFWYNATQGPANVTRNVLVPNWDTISSNYEKRTLKNLEYLMNEFKPSGGGQLIIFHGPPGTGKSYSLRALLEAWRDWCTADYILDPENLFSGSQGYMANLVLRGSSDAYELEDEEQEEEDIRDKWKLLILEDSGELLTADAKSRTGQGLSRLLNLVDGLIGQGLRVLVLITTNEEFDNLHPAVSREGRCAAAIKFRAFPYEDAQKWFEANSDGTAVLGSGKKEYTLAELFGKTREAAPDDRVFDIDTKTLGFAMR